MKATVVDKNYGNATPEELVRVQEAYKRLVSCWSCGTLTWKREIIAGCWKAVAILTTGNPPITQKALEILPKLKFV